MDFRRERVHDLAASVRNKERSARELVAHALERIEATNGPIRAFVATDGDRALEQARALDEAIAHGIEGGPLAGIPIGVKDLEDAAGYVTTFGSAALEHRPAATESSIVVRRLEAAGAIVVGKTNTPELGAGPDTTNLLFGPTFNPWSLEHTPGGSSGGSTAAVAAGMVPLATGSDGGGSIRTPASCCALTGFKPSLGRVPAGGPRHPNWMDLATKGIVGRTMSEVVEGLGVIVGPDPSDLRSLPMPDNPWRDALADPHPPVRIAWSATLGFATAQPEILEACERAIAVLSDLGADVTTVETVFEEDPFPDWLTMTNAFNYRAMAHLEGTPRWDLMTPGLRHACELGAGVSAMEVIHALDQCHALNYRLVELFRDVRLLVTPTCTAPPPRSGQGEGPDGLPDRSWVRYTYPFNMTRSPAASVCVGFTTAGLPIGIQLIGPQHADLVVIRTAAALEQALGLDPVAPGWDPA